MNIKTTTVILAVLLSLIESKTTTAVVGTKNAGKSRLINRLTRSKHQIDISPYIIEQNIPKKGWLNFFSEDATPLFPMHQVNDKAFSLPCVTITGTDGCTFFSMQNEQLTAPKLTNLKSNGEDSTLCLNTTSNSNASPCDHAPTYEDKVAIINGKKTRVMCTKKPPRKCLTPRPLQSFSTKESIKYCDSDENCYIDNPAMDACCDKNSCPHSIESMITTGTARVGDSTISIDTVVVLSKTNCTDNIISHLSKKPVVRLLFLDQMTVDGQPTSDIRSFISPTQSGSGSETATTDPRGGFRFPGRKWSFPSLGEWTKNPFSVSRQLIVKLTSFLTFAASAAAALSLAAIILSAAVGDSSMSKRVTTAWKAANVRYEQSQHQRMLHKKRRSTPIRKQRPDRSDRQILTNFDIERTVTFDDIASAALNLSEKLQEKHLQPSERIPQLPQLPTQIKLAQRQPSQCPTCGIGVVKLGSACSHSDTPQPKTPEKLEHKAPVEGQANALHAVTACVAVAFGAYRQSKYQRVKSFIEDRVQKIIHFVTNPLRELGLIRPPQDKSTAFQRLKGAAARLRDRWKEYMHSVFETVTDSMGRLVPDRIKYFLEPYYEIISDNYKIAKRFTRRRVIRMYRSLSVALKRLWVVSVYVAGGLVERFGSFLYFLVRPPDPSDNQLAFETVKYQRINKTRHRRDSTDSDVSSIVDLTMWDYADPLRRKLKRSHHKMGCTSRLLQEVERNLQEVDDLQDSWLYDKSTREMKEHVIGMFQGFRRTAAPGISKEPKQPCVSTQTPSRFMPRPEAPQRYVKVSSPVVKKKIKPYRDAGGVLGSVRRVSQFMGYLVWPWGFENSDNDKEELDLQSDTDSDEPFLDPSATPSEQSIDPLVYTTRDPHGSIYDLNPPVELPPAAKRMARRRKPNPHAWAATNCDATSELESIMDPDLDGEDYDKFVIPDTDYNASFPDMRLG